jgi:hypothetical protein
MVNLASAVAYSIYCDTASAEGRAFILALHRAVVKEVSLCLYRTSHHHLPLTNHVNAEQALPHSYKIWKAHSSAELNFGLCMPLEVLQLHHTLYTEHPTTFSDQA